MTRRLSTAIALLLTTVTGFVIGPAVPHLLPHPRQSPRRRQTCSRSPRDATDARRSFRVLGA